MSSSVPLKMQSSLFCQACTKPYIQHPRHLHHQRFCLDHSCQRARRRQNQRLRRDQAQNALSRSMGVLPVGRSWVAGEAAMKPCEAVLSQFHPVIIGLISQFIDSTSREDIVAFVRRCAARGQDILCAPVSMTTKKRPNSKPRMKRRVAADLEAA